MRYNINASKELALVQTQKKDPSKIKFFDCNNFGQQDFKCSQKKGRNGEQKEDGRSTPKQKRKDLSKIKCFKYLTIDHFSSQFPQNKRKERQHETDVEELAPQKKRRQI